MTAAASALQTKYCIDSSSLIYCRQYYPIDIFKSLWDGLDALVKNGRLIAHEEVWIEINKGADFMTVWAAQWKTEFSVQPDANQVAQIQQIAKDFPQANYTSITEHRADPWVVALANTQSCCVVSQEKGESSPFPKIPQMCLKYGVTHLMLWDLLRAEGWVF